MSSLSIDRHFERNVIRVQLKQNVVLKEMTDDEHDELEPHLQVVDCNKGRGASCIRACTRWSSTSCSKAF